MTGNAIHLLAKLFYSQTPILESINNLSQLHFSNLKYPSRRKKHNIVEYIIHSRQFNKV